VVRYEREEPIPLLEEVLAECTLAFNIELKMTFSFWQTEVARVTAQVIRDARAEDRVIVTSFDPRKLRATTAAHPSLTTGYTFSDNMLNFARPVLRDPLRMLGRIVEAHLFGGTVVGAEHTILGAQTVERLHRRGISIGTHTLFPIGSTTGKAISPTGNSLVEVERLLALGVDWIETDDPDRLLRLVG
jgi:glycerophosphoryl diester phosphodiesterase